MSYRKNTFKKINIAREKLQMPYKVQRNKRFYALAKKGVSSIFTHTIKSTVFFSSH